MNEEQLKEALLGIAIRQKNTDSLISELQIPHEDIVQLRKYYYSSRQNKPFWSDDLNRESQQIWQGSSRELVNTENRIVNDIRKNGIAFSSLEELFPNKNSLADLQEMASQRLADLAREDQKSSFEKAAFTQFLYGGGGASPELILTDPGISECLSDTALHIVGAYLESAPKFVRFSMQSTKKLPPNLERAQSQRWHRDPDDRHILKMFIYLNDVDSVGVGPFEYLKKSHSGGERSSLFPQTPPWGMYPDAEAVENQIEPHEVVTGLGEAGTVIFADTSGLHRGGYSTQSERIMFAGIYVSSASLFGKRYVLADNFELSEFPPLVQYAVT